MSLTLSANAKINLGLRITGRRADGYHLIHTLFQEIDFGDEITLTDQFSGEITLEVTGPAAENVPTDEDNLCLRAARLFMKKTEIGRGVRVRLEKRIPAGAGLGGGSSDAAAVLKGLNELWQVNLSPAHLEAMAIELGADVPFFIHGGLQLGESTGEVLRPLERGLAFTVVLVIPSFGVDTAWAYRQFVSRESFPPPPSFETLINQDAIPWEAFSNDFEEVVFPRYGQLAEIKATLMAQGAVHASLSGSGSAVYGLFKTTTQTNELQEGLPNRRVVIVRLISAPHSE